MVARWLPRSKKPLLRGFSGFERHCKALSECTKLRLLEVGHVLHGSQELLEHFLFGFCQHGITSFPLRNASFCGNVDDVRHTSALAHALEREQRLLRGVCRGKIAPDLGRVLYRLARLCHRQRVRRLRARRILQRFQRFRSNFDDLHSVRLPSKPAHKVQRQERPEHAHETAHDHLRAGVIDDPQLSLIGIAVRFTQLFHGVFRFHDVTSLAMFGISC
nr:MAG TPA_asm: hypothetical protein [Caudoviricetes sp.]